jgi:NADPH:quinone reductase-like Zn-dependent oxidoreductase
MKAIVVHQYGGPEVLRFEDYPDPVAGSGQVLVRVAAASVNPIDYKRRAGLTKDFYPIHFPGLIGVDMAGTVLDWAGSRRLFRWRPGVRHGGQYLRRTLCRECGGLGEDTQGA